MIVASNAEAEFERTIISASIDIAIDDELRKLMGIPEAAAICREKMQTGVKRITDSDAMPTVPVLRSLLASS
jgi:hypothetical protein